MIFRILAGMLLLSLAASVAIAMPGERQVSVQRITLFDDYYNSGEDLMGSVRIKNTGDYDLENVTVNVFIPELAVKTRLRTFDLDDDDHISRRINMDLPEVEPGWYIMRFSISDGDGNLREVRHRWVEIR
jgi:hypothetical protein